MTRPTTTTSIRRANQAAREHDTGWMAHANCLGVDPGLFFPGRGEPTEPAKSVCTGCVVREPCLEYALAPPLQKHGIWGGMSERERRRLRRQRAQAARAVRLDGAA